MSQSKGQFRIELTPEQKAKVRNATGKDAEAVELSVEELEERIAPGKWKPAELNFRDPPTGGDPGAECRPPSQGRHFGFWAFHPLTQFVPAPHFRYMTDLLGVPLSSADDLRQEVVRLRLLHSLTLEFKRHPGPRRAAPPDFRPVLAALDAEGGSLWVAEVTCCARRLAVGGGSAQRDVGAQMPVGSGFVGDVVQNPRTTMVIEAVKDPRFSAATDQVEETAVTSTIMATAMVARASPSGRSRSSTSEAAPERLTSMTASCSRARRRRRGRSAQRPGP
jgi:hypothetical protein